MQIGDKKTGVVNLGDCRGITKTGTVVYIHPDRRFYTVEYELGSGKVRESYYFPARNGTDEPAESD